jgi:exopolysaccharide biosynthesis protein
MAGARSAVGVTRDGELLLASASGATIYEMARAMQALGAHDAMNLDGGASSGLWVGGRYLTAPGRSISHSLLVVGVD